MDIWAAGKDPFKEFCEKLMGLALKRKDKQFNDFCYQQETQTNLKPVNSETNPDPVSKTINSLKIPESIRKQRLILTKEPSTTKLLRL